MEFIRFKRLGVTCVCSVNDVERARALVNKNFKVERKKDGSPKTITAEELYSGIRMTTDQSISEAANRFDEMAASII